MKLTLIIILLVCLPNLSAVAQTATPDPDINALVGDERAFSLRSASQGMRDAFLMNLADDAVVFRPRPVNGKKHYQSRPPAPGILTWEPIHAEVSSAGDLGFTTGPWEYRQTNPSDTAVAFGDYVSVWRKQSSGVWKVIADIGIDCDRPIAAPESLSFPTVMGLITACLNRYLANFRTPSVIRYKIAFATSWI